MNFYGHRIRENQGALHCPALPSLPSASPHTLFFIQEFIITHPINMYLVLNCRAVSIEEHYTATHILKNV